MQAVTYTRFGGAEVLQLEQLPEPEVGPGQLSVRVHAASVNPIDFKLRSGKLRWLLPGLTLPRVPGSDFAGRVTAVGPGVEGFAPGDRVCGQVPLLGRPMNGSFREQVLVEAEKVVKVPAEVSLVDAAALPIAGTTALTCLEDLGRLKPGERLLVHGASGGVGHLAVQMGRLLGAHVTATGRAASLDFLSRELGAHEAVDRDTDAWRREGGYDVVLDAAAVLGWSGGAPLLAKGGRYITTVGRPAVLLWRLAALLRGRRAAAVMAKREPLKLERMLGWMRDGRLRLVVGASFPLERAADAHRAVEQGGVRGKVVVMMPRAA